MYKYIYLIVINTDNSYQYNNIVWYFPSIYKKRKVIFGNFKHNKYL